jgi:hypothetical protein
MDYAREFLTFYMAFALKVIEGLESPSGVFAGVELVEEVFCSEKSTLPFAVWALLSTSAIGLSCLLVASAAKLKLRIDPAPVLGRFTLV